MTAAPAYASFGRRVAALAIDSCILAAALAAAIVMTNFAFGPVLAAFWSSKAPVQVSTEVASRTSDRTDDGSLRETAVSRETRLFSDGTVRIYLIVDGRTTARDGAVATTHIEELIGRNARDLLRAWLTGAAGFLLAFAYFAILEASAARATPGKALLGLRVTDLSGRRLGLGRSLFRQLMKCAEIASSGITYVIAAFTGRRQALHDIFAGTLVVRTAPQPVAPPQRAVAF
jgi:uncharacterized RDD family membrane protein YckC